MMELHLRRVHLTEPEVRYYMKQLCLGIQFLHNKQIIHRDLKVILYKEFHIRRVICLEIIFKLGNIFSDGNMQVKIGDFGLSRDETTYSASFNSTFPYRWAAPKVWRARLFSIKADVWSFGALVTEVFTKGKPPFHNFDSQQEIFYNSNNCLNQSAQKFS